MKKTISLLLVVCFIFVCLSGSFAVASTDTPGASTYTTRIGTLTVSQNTITLKHNGVSAFLNAIFYYNDGTYKDVSKLASWTTSDQKVAYAFEGRILAMGRGTATISVTYEGIKEEIKVKVLENKNLEELIKPGIGTMSLSDDDRSNIILKASAMYNVTWVPTQNLTGWKGKYTFSPGTTYRGIVYSQTEYQQDDIGFNAALSYSDFYNSYTRWGITMPKYGNDCSAFVSFAWGIPRISTYGFIDGIKNGTYRKVGNYNEDSPSYDELMNSYKQLQRGDAVVKSDHMFIIGTNYSTWSVCYEQTPPYAQLTYWDHTTMASQGYMPISKD